MGGKIVFLLMASISHLPSRRKSCAALVPPLTSITLMSIFLDFLYVSMLMSPLMMFAVHALAAVGGERLAEREDPLDAFMHDHQASGVAGFCSFGTSSIRVSFGPARAPLSEIFVSFIFISTDVPNYPRHPIRAASLSGVGKVKVLVFEGYRFRLLGFCCWQSGQLNYPSPLLMTSNSTSSRRHLHSLQVRRFRTTRVSGLSERCEFSNFSQVPALFECWMRVRSFHRPPAATVVISFAASWAKTRYDVRQKYLA